jgi:NAD(P)-dependent dehydrogenase (short-subunit alcohol dehydrogenase family)
VDPAPRDVHAQQLPGALVPERPLAELVPAVQRDAGCGARPGRPCGIRHRGYSDQISVQSSTSLAGEVAIVTGGSRGIGRAIVELFVEHGACVVFCGRDAAAGREVVRGLPSDRAAFQVADVGLEVDLAGVVALCVERFGAPTILVNNAGVNANHDAVTMTETEWDRFFDIDLKAAWLAAKHVLPHMVRAGRGAIVNVSSLHAFATLDGFFPYAAAKSGLVGLTRSLALDYGPQGIRVNVVAPGFVRTRLVQESIDRAEDAAAAERAMVAGVALGRIGSPAEIASVVRFLASDEAAYVTGASLLVDGGLTARRAG